MQNYKKNNQTPPTESATAAQISSFRQFSFLKHETNPNFCIVSTIGGKIQCIRADKLYQKFCCNLENAESFVEKFLLIKDIEQELASFNSDYFLELERNKAIFWFQRQESNSFDGIDIKSF